MGTVENDSLLGELNVNDAGRQVWLLKVPKALAEAWMKVPPDGTLGYITQDKSTNKVCSFYSFV